MINLMKYPTIILIICITLLAGCERSEGFGQQWTEGEVLGVRPIFSETNLDRSITMEPPRNEVNIIDYRRSSVFSIMLELGEGLHIVGPDAHGDIRPLYFLNIPGNYTVDIQDESVIVDNYNDLVTIQVDTNSFQILDRQEDVIEYSNFPTIPNLYFNCIENDHSKIYGWENIMLDRPNCFTN